MSPKKILVTGADGFIGSHLTEELVRQGHKVRAFVYYNSFSSWGWLDHTDPEVKKSLEIVAGDIRDAFSVQKAIAGCEVVMHLAALISIPYSYHSPGAYVDTNVKGTLHVLEAAREAKVERVIHVSTSEVYGSAQFVPITEAHPLQAQSPYAASKIAADQLAMSFYYSFGLPVSIIRPFNTYGPRQSARAVIPTIITQLASGLKEIKLGALHPTRDFTYIADTVRGFTDIANSERAVGEVINIGSNLEISIGELVRLIGEVMDMSVEIKQDPVRLRPSESEVARLWADNQKAEQLTGWKPMYSGREGLEKGLRETVEWFLSSNHLSQYKAEICNI